MSNNACTQLFIGEDPKPAYVVSGIHTIEEFQGVHTAVVIFKENLGELLPLFMGVSETYYGPLQWTDLKERDQL